MGYIIFIVGKPTKLYNSLRQGLRPYNPTRKEQKMAIEYLRNSTHHGKNAQLSDYIERKGQYSGKEDFVCSGEGNLPSWAANSHDFWNAADASEIRNQKARKNRNGKIENEMKRKDEAGKHIIIALPKEFSNEELSEMAQEVAQKIAGNDHAYTYGVHINRGTLSDEKNPHLHLFLCTRKKEPNRAEPDRDNYFRKTRSCKDGTVNGGYHKDDEIVGKNRTKWTEKQKVTYEKICNKYIQKHNEKTGENVRKISFKERHGKGERHLGKNAIAVGIKERSKLVQKELDRRIEKEVQIQQKNVENAEKMAIQKCTNLYFEEKIVLNAKKAVNFVRYWGDKSKRKEENERIELDMRREKLNDHQKQQIFVENRQNNERIAGDRVLKKIETFNQGLQAEAKRRRIKNPVEYHSTNLDVKKFEEAKIQQEQERIRQEEENRRWEKQQKIAEEFQQRRAIFKENCNDGIEINGKIYRFKVVENWDFFELQKLYENQKLEKMLDFAKEKGLLQEPEQPKFERQPERITPIRTTERTTERKTAKKKNRGFER